MNTKQEGMTSLFRYTNRCQQPNQITESERKNNNRTKFISGQGNSTCIHNLSPSILFEIHRGNGQVSIRQTVPTTS